MLVTVAKLDVAIDVVEEPEHHLKACMLVGSKHLEVLSVSCTDTAVCGGVFELTPLEVDVSNDRNFLANPLGLVQW